MPIVEPFLAAHPEMRVVRHSRWEDPPGPITPITSIKLVKPVKGDAAPTRVAPDHVIGELSPLPWDCPLSALQAARTGLPSHRRTAAFGLRTARPSPGPQIGQTHPWGFSRATLWFLIDRASCPG